MILAKPRGGIAVVEQHPADGRLVLGNDAVVAGEPRRLLRDHAKPDRMMVPAGDQRGASRGAERRRMDVVVTQSVPGNAIHRGRRDNATKGAWHAKTRVVGDDQQHVGRAGRRRDARRPPRFRLEGVILYLAPEFRVRRRQLLAADRGGGAGRTQGAGDLLRHQRRSQQQRAGNREQATDWFGKTVHARVPRTNERFGANTRPPAPQALRQTGSPVGDTDPDQTHPKVPLRPRTAWFHRWQTSCGPMELNPSIAHLSLGPDPAL